MLNDNEMSNKLECKIYIYVYNEMQYLIKKNSCEVGLIFSGLIKMTGLQNISSELLYSHTETFPAR